MARPEGTRPEGEKPESLSLSSRPASLSWFPAALLAGGDFLAGNAAVALSVWLRGLLIPWFPIEISPAVYTGVLWAVSLLPVAYGLGRLYPGYGQTAVERLRKRTTISLSCFGAMLLFDYLAQNGQWSRGILLMAAACCLVILPLWDACARAILLRLGWWGQPVVVLGATEQRKQIVDSLRRVPEIGWQVCAEAELETPGHLLPGQCTLALIALSSHPVSLPAVADHLPFRHIVLVPDFAGMQSLWVSVRDLGNCLGLEMQRNLLIRRNQVIKRGLDLLFGSLGLLLSVPVIALAGALVVTVSPGPVFFSQIRYGRNGQPFRMWKLRSMHTDAEARLQEVIQAAGEEWHKTMKLRHDPRIVPLVGPLIRRFSIDELPQFLNVIRGEMSLIGPRPLPPYHLEQFSQENNGIRSRVLPGITGLWQVSGRSETGLEEQQQLDTYYVRNWSLWLDLHIAVRTIAAVLGGHGAR